MLYVWGYCEGWEGPEVLMQDPDGVFHRIADGELAQGKVKVLGPVQWPGEVMGGEVRLWS